ncbi:hypothetical protein [Phyllobacterium myrsinacearum]|uniref:Uncharacterized protein n=1 Tax=Phyllobacterium myrsinacearum TaxID=28101 RepID=A0A839EG84_9HYPH|nr:hypothetical protein [Phyllobacterium myrsinacearum]MBA8879193.1 hypothetical protein [Phyllobacterium myrsinacearum]
MQTDNVTASVIHNAARPEIIEARLTNFEMGATSLTTGHMLTLDRWIVPVLVGGGSVSIIGINSVGENIAMKRANAVYDYLNAWIKGVNAKVGTMYASSGLDQTSPPQVDTLTTMADSKDPLHRAVQVAAWKGSTPPAISRPNFGAHPTLVKRVIRASRTTMEHREIGGENSKRISGFKLGVDAIKSANSKHFSTPGFQPKYDYSYIPQNHTLNSVIYSVLNRAITYTGETVNYQTKVIEYIYGDPSPSVTYTKRSADYYASSTNTKIVEMTPEKADWRVDQAKVILRKDIERELSDSRL